MSGFFDEQSGEWDKHLYRVERARIVADAIKRKIPLSGSEIALDFGCGTGLLGFNFTGAVRQVWFGDTSEGMLSEVSAKITGQNIGNAVILNTGKQVPAVRFELIMSLMTLHHLEDVPAEISRLCGWLGKSGYIALCDLDKEDGSFHDQETVPHNGFERRFIMDCLAANGITELEDETVYINRKICSGKEKDFPVFMITGRKDG